MRPRVLPQNTYSPIPWTGVHDLPLPGVAVIPLLGLPEDVHLVQPKEMIGVWL